MVNTKEKIALTFGALAIVAGIGLQYLGADDANRSDQEMIDRLEVIELNQEEIRQQQELMLHALLAKFDEKPEPAPPKPPEPELKMPWGSMVDCVYAYSALDLVDIDTVAHPVSHHSWVLGGQCEKLAHDLRDKEYPGEVWNPEIADTLELEGMCVGYTDDSPIQAKKCQKNMQRWLEVFCWNTLEDNEIRACKRNQLMTSLDHEPDEKPW